MMTTRFKVLKLNLAAKCARCRALGSDNHNNKCIDSMSEAEIPHMRTNERLPTTIELSTGKVLNGFNQGQTERNGTNTATITVNSAQ